MLKIKDQLNSYLTISWSLPPSGFHEEYLPRLLITPSPAQQSHLTSAIVCLQFLSQKSCLW